MSTTPSSDPTAAPQASDDHLAAAKPLTDSALRRLRLPTMRAVLGDAIQWPRRKGGCPTSARGAVRQEVDTADRRSPSVASHPPGFRGRSSSTMIDYDANGHLNAAIGINTSRPRRLGLRRGRPALPHRRLRHRQEPPAHRPRHRRCGERVSRQIHARDTARERARRSRRRTPTACTIARYGRVDLPTSTNSAAMERTTARPSPLFQVLM